MQVRADGRILFALLALILLLARHAATLRRLPLSDGLPTLRTVKRPK